MPVGAVFAAVGSTSTPALSRALQSRDAMGVPNGGRLGLYKAHEALDKGKRIGWFELRENIATRVAAFDAGE